MKHETAPCRLLIWLGAAVLGWAVLIGASLFFPEALAGLAVAGVLLWRRSRRPVDLTVPDELVAAVEAAVQAVPTGAPAARGRDDVRQLVAHSV